MPRELYRWRLHPRPDKTLTDLARILNPIIQGWINYRPLLQQSADDRLKRIQHRARSRSRIARRLTSLGQPLHCVPVDANRRAISRYAIPSAAIARTCGHSTARRTSPVASLEIAADDIEAPDGTGRHRARRVATLSSP
jgi:Group II intron, maturase-specific domain